MAAFWKLNRMTDIQPRLVVRFEYVGQLMVVFCILFTSSIHRSPSMDRSAPLFLFLSVSLQPDKRSKTSGQVKSVVSERAHTYIR